MTSINAEYNIKYPNLISKPHKQLQYMKNTYVKYHGIYNK